MTDSLETGAGVVPTGTTFVGADGEIHRIGDRFIGKDGREYEVCPNAWAGEISGPFIPYGSKGDGYFPGVMRPCSAHLRRELDEEEMEEAHQDHLRRFRASLRTM